MWPMIGWTSNPVSGAATHSPGNFSISSPNDWKMRLMFAFCSAKPIWMPKKPKLTFHMPAKPCRGFSIISLPWPLTAVVGKTCCSGRRAGQARGNHVYEYLG